MHHFWISSIILAALGLSVSAPCNIGLIWHESFLKLMWGRMKTAMNFCQDPECIFGIFATEVPGRMLAWLKLTSEPDTNPMEKIPSASRALIKHWEGYECMVCLENKVLWSSPTHISTGRIFPCTPEFLRLLISLVVFRRDGLRKLRGRLDLTWSEMRTAVCGLSSNSVRDQQRLSVLASRLAFRDVALQCIRKMVKNQLDMGRQVYSWETRDTALESIRRTGRNPRGVNASYHIFKQCMETKSTTLISEIADSVMADGRPCQ
ncbi:hypothetical protein C8R45DRAFT_943378 [Mycena sanguinolenta]|nr:hypothetical protein C8R45DRAFT_943378 [Mycena sanguinolenta]